MRSQTFLNCYLAALQPTLGYFQGDNLTNPILITASELFRPNITGNPRNEVGSLSLAERLVRFQPGTFQFLSQRSN